jgi:3',5'-cyclic AMP phosphodiesterase CpdA
MSDHDHHDSSHRMTEYDVECERREMHRTLNPREERPDNSLQITRRMFLHKSLYTGLAAGAAGAAVTGWFPIINTITVAHAATPAFSFAWISDTHLYPKTLNSRFVDKTARAAKEVQAMNPPADFLIFGGDIAQLGRTEELELGNDLLKEVKIKKYFIPGEHDWYYDMGKKWEQLYGQPNWTFDHKGVRVIGLDTVTRGPDYWSATKMTPEMRMDHMATLDGTVAGAWAGVGDDQLVWLSNVLSGWKKDDPVLIFSHNPLYEYYPPWNFWVRDWRQLHEVLKPYSKVTNIHGHVHQVLYNEIGTFRSIGMLATAWSWPYPPVGVPKLTREMERVDPGDIYDGNGWGLIKTSDTMGFEPQYVAWGRKEVFGKSVADTSVYHPQTLHPRIADNGWFWKNDNK